MAVPFNEPFGKAFPLWRLLHYPFAVLPAKLPIFSPIQVIQTFSGKFKVFSTFRIRDVQRIDNGHKLLVFVFDLHDALCNLEFVQPFGDGFFQVAFIGSDDGAVFGKEFSEDGGYDIIYFGVGGDGLQGLYEVDSYGYEFLGFGGELVEKVGGFFVVVWFLMITFKMALK